MGSRHPSLTSTALPVQPVHTQAMKRGPNSSPSVVSSQHPPRQRIESPRSLDSQGTDRGELPVGGEDVVLLLARCPGRKQEVFAGPWEGRRAVLSFRSSVRPCHTPGPPHPTKTQAQTAHRAREVHAARTPAAHANLTSSSASRTGPCLRAFAHAVPTTWSTLLSAPSSAGSFSATSSEASLDHLISTDDTTSVTRVPPPSFLLGAPTPNCAAAKSRQSCPTLCDPVEGSTPGSSVPGILQARTLEWVATAFSPNCVDLSNFLSLSGPWLPQEQNRYNDSLHSKGLLQGLKEIIHTVPGTQQDLDGLSYHDYTSRHFLKRSLFVLGEDSTRARTLSTLYWPCANI